MKTELQYRTNNAYDSVLLVEVHPSGNRDIARVLSDWTVDAQVMHDFCDCTQDANDWDNRNGDEHKASDYGDLLVVRDGYSLTVATTDAEWADRVERYCH